MLVTMIRTEQAAAFTLAEFGGLTLGKRKGWQNQSIHVHVVLLTSSKESRMSLTIGDAIDTGCFVGFTTLFVNKTIHKCS